MNWIDNGSNLIFVAIPDYFDFEWGVHCEIIFLSTACTSCAEG